MRIQHILVPIDFSTCSLQVASGAGELAAQTGARVTLLHVAELPEGLAAQTPVQHEGREMSARAWAEHGALERMAPYGTAARAGGATTLELSVQAGPVAETIRREAESRGADLILMGTHGRTGVARAMLGSVAEEVTRHADVPVMLVRRHPRPECKATSCAWCHERTATVEEEDLRAESSG